MPDVAAVTGIDIDIMPEDSFSIPKTWKLLTDESVEEPDGPVTLEDIVVLEDGESLVVGAKVLERARKSGNCAGVRCAMALLRQQHVIPVEWRGNKSLVFAGTVIRSPKGYHFVAYLYWSGRQWDLHWVDLGSSFDIYFHSHCRSVRCTRK